MGITEATKIKILTVWAPVLNQQFFKLRTQEASEDP
jgi:hypothetical protein